MTGKSLTDTETAPKTASSPSPSRVVLVGNPEGRRVTLFREALGRTGCAAVTVVPYLDLLAGRVALADAVTAGSVVRVESPDRDFEVERALIAAGADEPDDEAPAALRVPRDVAALLEPDRGRLLYPRQWFLGFRRLLRGLGRQRADCPPHTVMNTPAAIEVMFDKPRCHALFVERGIACPRGLGTPVGYDDLRERMRRAGVGRAFVKLAHGSSASGVVALETAGRRVQAFTTVEAVNTGGGMHLYNTRSIRRETSEPAVAALVDALCRERAHAERWVPKASLPGGSFDLRVLVIAGRARHAVARLSRSPMTNLHLLNQRGDPGSVRARMTPDAWDAALGDCERAAGVVPGALYAGVDLVIAAGFRRHAVLEINAFGDLLPGISFEDMDTYTAELAALGVSVGRGAA